MSRRRASNQKKVDILKSKLGCAFCDETEPRCLDFHHVKKEDKKYIVSVTVQTKSWHAVETEIAKCIIVCSNCHRKIHKGVKLIPKLQMLTKIAQLL